MPLIVGIVVVGLVATLAVVGLLAASDSEPDGTSDQVIRRESPTTTVVVDRPLIPAEALYAVSGLTFGPLPEGSLDVARSPFDSIPDLRGTLMDLSGRTVLRNGSPYAVVLVYQFTAKFTSIPGASHDFLKGISQFGTDHEDATVGSQPALHYKVGSSLDALAVLKGNVAVLVQGPQPTSHSRLEQIASGLLQNVP